MKVVDRHCHYLVLSSEHHPSTYVGFFNLVYRLEGTSESSALPRGRYVIFTGVVDVGETPISRKVRSEMEESVSEFNRAILGHAVESEDGDVYVINQLNKAVRIVSSAGQLMMIPVSSTPGDLLNGD